MGLFTGQRIPFQASKRNVFSNLTINSLFGLGIYLLYKDHQLKEAKKIDPPRLPDPGTMPISSGSKVTQAISNLSYRELSFIVVGFGFTMQLANMAHISFGRQSSLYKLGVASVILYLPLTSYLYSSRIQTNGS
ncbi:LADA_0E04588g1_1 [Lachancea dasiensis]|uniref:LADA_0E04588g1_1 n=1 Tax=Lachancea dasiensis TaxID=1072105 RepID=A0A1G4JCC7_9SACH|nr:LADA_0E04588g1_1 [Lachancea dasiensis]